PGQPPAPRTHPHRQGPAQARARGEGGFFENLQEKEMTNETVTTYIDAEVQRFIRDVAECEGATQPLRDRAQSLSACMAGIADAEAEADADIRAGRVLHFGSVDKALAHLERVTAAGAEDAPKNFYA